MAQKHHTHEEKVKVAGAICERYATDKYTIDSCCKKHGITHRTFRNWCVDVSEVSDLYLKAQQDAANIKKERLKEKALQGLEKLISGYKVTEETREQLVNQLGRISLDDEGQPIEKVKKVMKHVGPNPTAIIFTLTNRDPEEWKNSQNINSKNTNSNTNLNYNSEPLSSEKIREINAALENEY